MSRDAFVFAALLATGAAAVAWLARGDDKARLDATLADVEASAPDKPADVHVDVRESSDPTSRVVEGTNETDPAILACRQALARLASPKARQSIRERTSLASVQRDARSNPDGRGLSLAEVKELGKLLADWDRRVEDAHFAELRAHWQSTLAALRRGEVRTYSRGQQTTYDRIVRDAARAHETIVDLPGVESTTGRLVVLARSTSPDYFRFREQHESLRKQRDEALAQFFSKRSVDSHR